MAEQPPDFYVRLWRGLGEVHGPSKEGLRHAAEEFLQVTNGNDTEES